ncbi:G5 domain-containing protein [Lachnospiraceae bacterium NSJ-143]|nr:G5 domain-containing protein [Lachnospiraceae bacterium NSJ-143]
MTKHIRILIMVAFAIAVLTGTAAAYDGENSENNMTKKLITISDNGEKDVQVYTLTETVGDFLKEQKIQIGKDDTVSKALDERLKDGDEISIKRPLNITLDVNGEITKITTTKNTVGEILSEYHSLLGDGYELQGVKESNRLYKNMTIKITKPTDEIVTSTEEIPYETKYVDNADIEEGKEKVSQEGKNGILEITKKQIYVNGKIDRVEETGRQVIKEPVDKIIQVGTKKKAVEQPAAKAAVSNASGSIDGINYKSAIKMVSTAYTPNDPGCTGTTSTGIPAKKGVVAIDPSVIPYGTKLYIPGYGTAVAADTGGAINGNRIDLCYNTLSEAYGWGRRSVTVYILE